MIKNCILQAIKNWRFKSGGVEGAGMSSLVPKPRPGDEASMGMRLFFYQYCSAGITVFSNRSVAHFGHNRVLACASQFQAKQ